MYYLVFIYFLGKPVDRPEDIDYVLTVFAFKHRQLSAARSEERRNRIDRRRRVAEAQEHEEENQEKRNMKTNEKRIMKGTVRRWLQRAYYFSNSLAKLKLEHKPPLQFESVQEPRPHVPQ